MIFTRPRERARTACCRVRGSSTHRVRWIAEHRRLVVVGLCIILYCARVQHKLDCERVSSCNGRERSARQLIVKNLMQPYTQYSQMQRQSAVGDRAADAARRTASIAHAGHTVRGRTSCGHTARARKPARALRSRRGAARAGALRRNASGRRRCTYGATLSAPGASAPMRRPARRLYHSALSTCAATMQLRLAPPSRSLLRL